MGTTRLLIYAILIAVLAGIVDLATNLLQVSGFVSGTTSLTFVTFICWAAYFLFGASPKGALSAFLGFIIGIVSAIAMQVVAGNLISRGMEWSTLGVPLAVFIVVIFMVLFEKVPFFNNVAAIFLGTGLFFGLSSIPDIAAKGFTAMATGELVYALIGFTAGWLTIMIRINVEKFSLQVNEAKQPG